MNARIQEAAARPRPVDLVLDSEIAPVGTFTVRRALPARARHCVGPWVFLDHFGPFRVTPGKDGVGAHPHAGIETVTYLLSGRNEHRDSAGHVGIVSAGGAQWMTAGRGVVHAERPLAEGEAEMTMHGIQLWTSLPRLQKMSEPRYQRIDAGAIPRVEHGGATVRVIAGDFESAHGPAVTTMPTLLWHVTLEPEALLRSTIAPELEAGLYVIEGRAELGEESVVAGQLAVWGAGGEVHIRNPGGTPLEAMVLGGADAEGPLVFHGPFVMNSVEQVRAAEIAYRTGRMGCLEEV